MANLLISNIDGDTLAESPLRKSCAITIGRSEGNDVVVNTDSISRRHVLVFDHEGRWFATDLGSKTGLSDEKGTARFHEFTSKDAWVRMGPAFIWIVATRPPVSPQRPSLYPDAPAFPVHLAREFARPVDELPIRTEASLPCHLIFRDENTTSTRLLDLSHVGRLTIGRGRTCDLVIDDPAVSRLHCIIYREGSRFFIADAGSSQGLRADGSRWLAQTLGNGHFAAIWFRSPHKWFRPNPPVDQPTSESSSEHDPIDGIRHRKRLHRSARCSTTETDRS